MQTTLNLGINDLDILSFRKMLREVNITDTYDAVTIRHKIQDLETAIKVWKDEADSLLDTFHSEGKIRVEDPFNNRWAVIKVANNERTYRATPAYRFASWLLSLATGYMKATQAVTPNSMTPRGRGFYYKVSKV